jgi:ubiquinone/menaquinone biosynthesis C-methylase UbiE
MKIKMHWDRQAGKGELSGTQDRIAKQLEMEAISRYVKDGMRVLDVGCGDGETLLHLASTHKLETAIGIDFSKEMIAQANQKKQGDFVVHFGVCDIQSVGIYAHTPPWDLIYTERTLINLTSWEEQRQAIIDIGSLLKPGGLYLMCECFQEGLSDINLLRQAAGLQLIKEPWHNRYLREDEILRDLHYGSVGKLPLRLKDRLDYSANYYFLSRVINAYAAAQSAVAIDYNSPINHLALKLTDKIVNIRGQGQLWVWRKLPLDPRRRQR